MHFADSIFNMNCREARENKTNNNKDILVFHRSMLTNNLSSCRTRLLAFNFYDKKNTNNQGA